MEIKFKSSSIILKDVEDGTVIEPVEIVVFEDENSRGDTFLITSIIVRKQVSKAGRTFVTCELE